MQMMNHIRSGECGFFFVMCDKSGETMQINRHGVTGISLICGAKFRGIQTFGNVFNIRNLEWARAGTC
jgi:hypothetical protein